MFSSYPLEPLVAAAATQYRAEIEAAAREERRHILVLDVTGLERTGAFTAHLNAEDHSVAALARDPADTFPRDVTHVWNNYDRDQVVPIIIVDLSRPFTGIIVGDLPWISAADRKPRCAHCGSTAGPCVGTAITATPTCR